MARGVVVRELTQMLPPVVFFAISFNVLVLTVALLSQGTAASLPSHAGATVAALVCGKAVLVADMLPFFNRYPEKPLIWNAAWKAGLYVLIALCFRLLERLIAAGTGEYGLGAGVEAELAAFSWPRFWAVQIWLGILFFGYAGFRELIGVVGRERVARAFFGPVAPAGAAPGAA
jgi:hypothetical protein